MSPPNVTTADSGKFRYVSTSSNTSTTNLEPLTEAFDLLTPLSPVPSPNASPAPRRRKESTEDVMEAKRRRKRSGSFTPATEPAAVSSAPSTVTIGTKQEGRIRNDKEKSPILEPTASPSPPSSTLSLPVARSSPLIADVNIAKSRLLVTKTHVFYPPPSPVIPFQSGILGFQLLIHPADPKARVKHTQITLTLHPARGEPASTRPIIKALYPAQGVRVASGDGTVTRHRKENQMGLSLGFDSWGAINLRHNSSNESEVYTSQYLLGSGVETSKLMLTLNEDPARHEGVPPSLEFAVLLYLPNTRTRAFEADMSVDTTAGGDIGGAIRRIIGSPHVWRLSYDGVTELGAMAVGGVDEIRRSLEEYTGGNASSSA